MDERLAAVGNELERAIAARIADERNIAASSGHVPGMERNAAHAHAHTRKRRAIVGAVVGAAVLVGVGTAAAVSLLSSDEVERGLPGGSLIFEGTNPACESRDDVVFDCTLASAPTYEMLSDYTGSAQLFVDDAGDIAGGCRGQDAAGLHWTCYVGLRAADEAILAPDLLGQHLEGPTVG